MASIVLDNVCVDFPIYDSDRSLRKLLFQAKVGGIVRLNQPDLEDWLARQRQASMRGPTPEDIALRLIA